MVLVMITGPHEHSHFTWSSSPSPPKKLKLQARQPMGSGRMGRRAVGVAVYRLIHPAAPQPRDLPLDHVGYEYVRFEAQDNPPFFEAVGPE